jgi:IS30 family transposase
VSTRIANAKSGVGYITSYNKYSPQDFPYSVKEVAQILGKAPDTIRKESRRAQIGAHKDGRYWFTNQDILSLQQSFEEKRLPRVPADNLLFTLFSRLTHVEQSLQRFQILFYEWFTNMEDWRARIDSQQK